MAGDWIKYDCDLRDKPKVRIAAMLLGRRIVRDQKLGLRRPIESVDLTPASERRDVTGCHSDIARHVTVTSRDTVGGDQTTAADPVFSADQMEALIGHVIAGLTSLWSLADQHSADGKLRGWAPYQIDARAGAAGFCEAVSHPDVGWLVIGDGFLQVPRWSERMTSSSKERKDVRERQSKSRKARNPVKDSGPKKAAPPMSQDVTVTSRDIGVTDPLPRRDEAVTEMRDVDVDVEKKKSKKNPPPTPHPGADPKPPPTRPEAGGPEAGGGGDEIPGEPEPGGPEVRRPDLGAIVAGVSARLAPPESPRAPRAAPPPQAADPPATGPDRWAWFETLAARNGITSPGGLTASLRARLSDPSEAGYPWWVEPEVATRRSRRSEIYAEWATYAARRVRWSGLEGTVHAAGIAWDGRPAVSLADLPDKDLESLLALARRAPEPAVVSHEDAAAILATRKRRLSEGA